MKANLNQKLARVCLQCPICRRARKRQRGFAFWLVKNVDARVCPFCRAYEKVHGRRSYEPQEVPPSLP